MGEKAVLMLVTTRGRDDAERLGEALVVEHLAASCSAVPSIASFYYEGDQLQRAHEALLLIKTVESRVDAVERFVRERHSYENPEIIQLAIEGGSNAYLSWLEGQVAKPGI